ncbi:hypothetical protein [Duganella sp. FT27W]|uniref:hypothetical protein n=1 Tax=Duganella sp. FT27W TaxID=2654636 RepID=UPI00128BF9D5|nr:hypothetical protein [Duganella sp. FT27W]MPQ56367.1 hypothetical protein [Duganella sp. FT27W]
MSNLPTLKEELDRKSFATVEWLYSSLERGRITPAQFSTGLDALFMAVSGITDDGVVDLITAGSGAAAKEVARVRRILVKGALTVLIDWKVADESVTVAKYSAGAQIGSEVKTLATPAAAREAMNAMVQKLLAMKFEEL